MPAFSAAGHRHHGGNEADTLLRLGRAYYSMPDCGFSGSFTQGFSPSFTHYFHDHAPAIFTIIHPPFSSSCTHPGVFHLQLLAECSSLATIRYGVSLLLASWRSESPFSFGSSKKVAFRKP